MRIAVLGLGPSLSLFNPDDFPIAVGVNDIWRYVQCEVVVCVDRRCAFNDERMKIIDECTPVAFYSQIANYEIRSDFVQIFLLPGYPDNFVQFESKELHKSFCSPFVAAQIAFKYYDATEIHLFGVDMINHPSINAKMREMIKIHFTNLAKALRERNCAFIVHGEGILKNI
jgi:hypothetical protein